jgi:hypothetical protein
MNTAPNALTSRIVYPLLIFLLFFAATVYRLRAPGAPFIDPDIRGYLKPALLALTHNGFHSIDGRSFVYPGFIYIILSLFPDFHAITTVQHLLGVAAGAVLLAAWNCSRHLVKAAITPVAFYRFLGILVAGLYLFNTSEFSFEHSIRPEAIFPFFTALSMLFNVEFIKHTWLKPNHAATLLLGSLNLFAAFLLFFLKPSFFLATCACLLPFCVSLFDKRQPPANRLLLVGVATLGIPVLLFLPEHHFRKDDVGGKAFLPTTLFVIHASIIRDQILSDIKTNARTPYATAFLQRTFNLLDQEIDISRQTGKYKSLGYDPDYLMYEDSFNRKFLKYWDQGDARDAQKQFYYYYFCRTWVHQTGQMLRKVLKQIAIFYNSMDDISPYKTDRHVAVDQKYKSNLTVADLTHDFISIDYTPLREFIVESKQLTDNRYRISEPSVVYFLGTVFQKTFTLCFVFGIGMAIVIASKRTLRDNYGCFAGAFMLFYTYSFANSLGIAFIHSLEIGRYSTNEFIYCLLPHAMTIWLAVEIFWLRYTGAWTSLGGDGSQDSGRVLSRGDQPSDRGGSPALPALGAGIAR